MPSKNKKKRKSKYTKEYYDAEEGTDNGKKFTRRSAKERRAFELRHVDL